MEAHEVLQKVKSGEISVENQRNIFCVFLVRSMKKRAKC